MDTHTGLGGGGGYAPLALTLVRVVPTQEGDAMSTGSAPGGYATSNIEELRLALQALGNAYASQVELLKAQVASEVERRRQSEQERERLRTEVEQLRRIEQERQRQEHEVDRGELQRFRERRDDDARAEAERLRNSNRDLSARIAALEKEKSEREKAEREKAEQAKKDAERSRGGRGWFG